MHVHWSDPVFYALIAIYALAVYNCIKVLGNRTSAGASIAWILLHLTVPYVAVPLYYLLGDFRIRGYVRRHRAAQQRIDDTGVSPLLEAAPKTSDLAPSLQANYRSFHHVFRQFGSAFVPQHGDVELLVDGQATFKAIFAAISSAKSYIIVQYYIVRSDRLGLELKRLLSERAKQGITVFMLYDDMGSFWLSRKYIRDLRQAGVKVERFLPIARFKRAFQVNFRNHRKLVVVDGQVAFTGGLNIGEEYAAKRSVKLRQRYWRDTHLQLTGGLVAQMEDVFFEDWYFSTKELIDLAQLATTSEKKPNLPMAEPSPHAVAARPAKKVLQLIPTGPTDATVISLLFVIQMINAAKERLWIATPYLVPDSSLVRALELAALRGVDVRLMIPRTSDSLVMQWVSLSYAKEMKSRGIQILLYVKGFMHQKVFLVDHGLAAIGTMNVDNRAMFLNFEMMVLIHDEAFNQQVAEMLETDFSTCRPLKRKTGRFRRYLETLRGNAASLLAPML